MNKPSISSRFQTQKSLRSIGLGPAQAGGRLDAAADLAIKKSTPRGRWISLVEIPWIFPKLDDL